MGAAGLLMVSQFERMMRQADRRIDQAFAKETDVILRIGTEQRAIKAIFENPDDPVNVPGGGDIRHMKPAISVNTADIYGLKPKCEVVIDGRSWWVVRVGADEVGRTRVTLASGKPGRPTPEITEWSQ